MPTLDFKGKPFVYAHHLSVPFRQLDIDAKKSVALKGGKPSLDDNLIIHGDNLHALKALLPKYAGKVKCIYIDPPYNTGNEGWCYNDNVNAPLMKEWLKKEGNPVDKEDLERHDKWLCMMWPRLQLLKELLSENGSIWISIDDVEVHRLRSVCDEIFGEENFISQIAWFKKVSPSNDAKWLSYDHEHIIAYCKDKNFWSPNRLERTEEQLSYYKNPDDDPRGLWNSSTYTCNKNKDERPNLYYPITNPNTGKKVWPKETAVWGYAKDVCEQHVAENRLYWGKDGKSESPRFKRFLSEVDDVVPRSVWLYDEVGHTQNATQELQAIFGKDRSTFPTPKPSKLIAKILKISSQGDDIVLDSFAGSGSTAHAVQSVNREEGANRKFILVEMEEYADGITAERVRRVIKGVSASKDEALKNGLGGSFTFCELGQEIGIENLLKGGNLPSYDELARYAFYTATGQALEKVKQGADYFVGETDQYRVHVLYRPDAAFLRSGESALNADLAASIAKTRGSKTALVFATHKFMGQKELTEMGITYCQLPYAIHRVMGD